jgi:hypothetical protein
LPAAAPEQVIRRIADFRAEDKADPLYYARHTVEKVLRQSTGEVAVAATVEPARADPKALPERE